MSPKYVLFALAAAALAFVASYVAGSMIWGGAATRTVVQPETVQPETVQPKTVQATPPPVVEQAQPSSIHAIVEPNGTVVLCLVNGEILLPDRCAGTGSLAIVQPIKEGEVVWVSATGVVAKESQSPENPDCAVSRATWDSTSERTTSTGRKLRKIPSEAVAQQLGKIQPGNAELMPEDISAFGLDLDGDGREDIVYAADNVSRIDKLNEKTGKPHPYFVQGGIFNGHAPIYPSTFLHDIGEYLGGTDAVSQVVLKGIVPIAPDSDNLAVLAKTGTGLGGDQSLVWFDEKRLQKIGSFEFRCNK